MDNGKNNLMSSMSPMQVFAFGIVEGVLVLCTIGFFIMLGVYFKGDSNSAYAKNVGSNNNVVANDPSGNLNPSAGAPTQITIAPIEEKVDHIRGNKNAKVTIVEYSDLECPFCKRFHATMLQVMDKYGDDIRWVYRHFPLDSLHQQARPEAMATECASEQGKFWELTDLIYAETTSNDGLDLAKLPDYAKQVGLNVSKFQTCYDSKKFADRVARDSNSGEAAGANGTPYSIVIGPNGETTPLSGALPFASIESAIQQYLK